MNKKLGDRVIKLLAVGSLFLLSGLILNLAPIPKITLILGGLGFLGYGLKDADLKNVFARIKNQKQTSHDSHIEQLKEVAKRRNELQKELDMMEDEWKKKE